HTDAVPVEVLELVTALCERHLPPALMLERDGHYPPASTLVTELDAIAEAAGLARTAPPPRRPHWSPSSTRSPRRPGWPGSPPAHEPRGPRPAPGGPGGRPGARRVCPGGLRPFPGTGERRRPAPPARRRGG